MNLKVKKKKKWEASAQPFPFLKQSITCDFWPLPSQSKHLHSHDAMSPSQAQINQNTIKQFYFIFSFWYHVLHVEMLRFNENQCPAGGNFTRHHGLNNNNSNPTPNWNPNQ